MIGRNCHDCGCNEGKLHHFGCDMERCPFCGNQLITCQCCYEKLNIDVSEGTWTYSHGLTDEQSKKWGIILRLAGRIPFVEIPNLCGLCGRTWPEMFGVSNEDWRKFVIPQLQEKILCKKCYTRMKKLFPKGWAMAKESKNG